MKELIHHGLQNSHCRRRTRPLRDDPRLSRPGRLRDGEEIPLTAKEYTLLRKLWDNRGNIVTIDALCEALWDGPNIGYENTLMVHIRRLRAKIERDPSHPEHLLTVRGLGYRLAREDGR